jgi:hypothetical protein
MSWRAHAARAITAFALISFSATMLPRVAFADAPTAQDLAEAKKFFDAGLKFSQQGAYRDALAAFREAKRLAPRPSIQTNLAQTHRDLREYAAAYDAYAELITTYPTQLKPQEILSAQRAMSELEAFTGTIEVKTQEPGARVSLDDVDVGALPLSRPLRASVGTHVLSITKDGFQPIKRSVELRGHDAIVISDPLNKAATTGHANVSVSPATAGAVVLVDNAEQGPAPVKLDLPPGQHVFSARVPGMGATSQRVDVQAGGNYEIVVALSSADALLSISTGVADAEIVLDGTVVGRGGYEGRVTAGRHEIQVRRSGYTSYAKTMEVRAGDRIVDSVTLAREGGGAPAAPAAHDYKGSYLLLRGSAQFELTQPSNDIANGVGYPANAKLATTGSLGFGIDGRWGYSFGPVGLELGLFATYRHGQSTVNVSTPTTNDAHPGTAPRVDDYDFHTLGGGPEIGVRFSPRMAPLRPTFGVAGGLGLMGAFYQQSITPKGQGTTSVQSDPTFYAVPRLTVDGGVLIGSITGPKLFVGVQMLTELNPPVSTNVAQSTIDTSGALNLKDGKPQPPISTAQVRVVNDVEIYVGPVVGIQL